MATTDQASEPANTAANTTQATGRNPVPVRRAVTAAPASSSGHTRNTWPCTDSDHMCCSGVVAAELPA